MSINGWDEYDQAIQYYEVLKTNFMSQLNIISRSQIANLENELKNIDTSKLGYTADVLIEKITNMIEADPALQNIRRNIAQYKEQHKSMSAQQIREYTTSLMNNYLSEAWRENLLQSLGWNTAMTDAAVLGRLSQLMNMALRHTALAPGGWTKSQIDGLLYESAITDALKIYFDTLGVPEWKNLIEITGIGAQGGRGDIKIGFKAEVLNKIVQGTASQELLQELQIQAKHFNLAEAFEDKKIKVGAGKRALNMKNYKGTPTAKATQRYLAKKDRIIAAIGSQVGMYAYGEQGLWFTSDFIREAHQRQKLWLTMPNIAKGNHYIEWRAWINNKRKRNKINK